MTESTCGASPMQAIHRTRLEQIQRDMIGLAGAAAKISQMIQQTLDRGGTVNIQPQLSFITGAHARLVKDWGVVEHLQAQGAVQRKRTM